jgi:hypothetical protein
LYFVVALDRLSFLLTLTFLSGVELVGHMCYVSMMMVDVHHNHPVLRTFVELLRQLVRERSSLTDFHGSVLIIFCI